MHAVPHEDAHRIIDELFPRGMSNTKDQLFQILISRGDAQHQDSVSYAAHIRDSAQTDAIVDGLATIMAEVLPYLTRCPGPNTTEDLVTKIQNHIMDGIENGVIPIPIYEAGIPANGFV